MRKKAKKTKIVRGKRKGPKRVRRLGPDFEIIGPGIVKLRKMPPGKTRLMFAVYWKNGLGVIELKGLPGPDPYKGGHILFQVASGMASVYAGILGIPPEEALASILVSLGDHAAEIWPDEMNAALNPDTADVAGEPKKVH